MSEPLSNDRLLRLRQQITQAPLRQVLWKLLVPSALAYVLNFAFFIGDTYFVSRLGTEPLAAMSLVTAVVLLTLTLAQGLTTALLALASVCIGAGQQSRVAEQLRAALVVSAVASAAVLLLGFATVDPLFRALGASERLMPHIRDYVLIWYAGYALVIAPALGQAVFRATGDALTPAFILIASGTLNLLLDPILIFGAGPIPALGVRGAALASLCGRVACAALTFVILQRRYRLLRPFGFRGLRTSIATLLRIALPVTLQLTLLVLTSACLLRIAAALGPGAVAGLGVGQRVEALATALVFGLPTVLVPFIGQNTGADQRRRAGAGTMLILRDVLGAQLLIALVMAAAAPSVAAAFSTEPAVRASIVAFVRYVPLSYLGLSLISAVSGLYIAMGRVRAYLALAVLPFALSVSAAWLGARAWGFVGMVGALSVARVAMGTIAFVRLRAALREGGYVKRTSTIGAVTSHAEPAPISE